MQRGYTETEAVGWGKRIPELAHLNPPKLHDSNLTGDLLHRNDFIGMQLLKHIIDRNLSSCRTLRHHFLPGPVYGECLEQGQDTCPQVTHKVEFLDAG